MILQLRSLVHLNYDCVAAQTQHQPLPLCDQTHDHTIPILQPQVTRAHSAQGKAIAALNVRAREVAEALQSVDLAPRLDLRYADPSNAEPADGEWVSVPPVPQGTVASIAAAQIGSLDLGHFHVTRHRFALYAHRAALSGARGQAYQSSGANREKRAPEPWRLCGGPGRGADRSRGKR